MTNLKPAITSLLTRIRSKKLTAVLLALTILLTATPVNALASTHVPGFHHYNPPIRLNITQSQRAEYPYRAVFLAGLPRNQSPGPSHEQNHNTRIITIYSQHPVVTGFGFRYLAPGGATPGRHDGGYIEITNVRNTVNRHLDRNQPSVFLQYGVRIGTQQWAGIQENGTPEFSLPGNTIHPAMHTSQRLTFDFFYECCSNLTIPGLTDIHNVHYNYIMHCDNCNGTEGWRPPRPGDPPAFGPPILPPGFTWESIGGGRYNIISPYGNRWTVWGGTTLTRNPAGWIQIDHWNDWQSVPNLSTPYYDFTAVVPPPSTGTLGPPSAPPGSIITGPDADGNYRVELPCGCWIIAPPGSTVVGKDSNGNINVQLPGGGSVTVPPGSSISRPGGSGNVNVTLPDGETVNVPPNSTVTRPPGSGNINVERPGGESVNVPPGSTVTSPPDNSGSFQVTPPGSGTVPAPPGSNVDNDGNVTGPSGQPWPPAQGPGTLPCGCTPLGSHCTCGSACGSSGGCCWANEEYWANRPPWTPPFTPDLTPPQLPEWRPPPSNEGQGIIGDTGETGGTWTLPGWGDTDVTGEAGGFRDFQSDAQQGLYDFMGNNTIEQDTTWRPPVQNEWEFPRPPESGEWTFPRPPEQNEWIFWRPSS